jgi:hypothetical protein
LIFLRFCFSQCYRFGSILPCQVIHRSAQSNEPDGKSEHKDDVAYQVSPPIRRFNISVFCSGARHGICFVVQHDRKYHADEGATNASRELEHHVDVWQQEGSKDSHSNHQYSLSIVFSVFPNQFKLLESFVVFQNVENRLHH